MKTALQELIERLDAQHEVIPVEVYRKGLEYAKAVATELLEKEKQQIVDDALIADEFLIDWRIENNTDLAVYSSYHIDAMEAYADYRLRKMSEQTKTNKMREGTYVCRMTDGYVKMCYWTGCEWKDMWKDTLEGEVKEWMEVPDFKSTKNK